MWRSFLSFGLETPPRAWGRKGHQAARMYRHGNTPTRVGKTSACLFNGVALWKHPHARGEDAVLSALSTDSRETPPRAWGRRQVGELKSLLSRNTPTRVGKTNLPYTKPRVEKKHPHARGEDEPTRQGRYLGHETPPRAWGRRRSNLVPRSAHGNTPTRVGKTGFFNPWASTGWKHPHARGEDDVGLYAMLVKQETPPRAWGRRHVNSENRARVGNTPTRVGKTATGSAWKLPKHYL